MYSRTGCGADAGEEEQRDDERPMSRTATIHVAPLSSNDPGEWSEV
jgi:hypothetical protein